MIDDHAKTQRAVVKGPWSLEGTLTPRQLLAKVRDEVPAVGWDPLYTHPDFAPGLEEVTGTSKRKRVTVCIQVMGHDVEVMAERQYSGAAATGAFSVKIKGKAAVVAAVVGEALALCGEVV